MTIIGMAETIHGIVKSYAAADGIEVNNKKSAIQLTVETPLHEHLQESNDRMKLHISISALR